MVLQDWLEIGIAVALGLCGYTYLVYPLLLSGASRFFGRRPTCEEVSEELGKEGKDWPRVCIVIAAYNEELVIAHKIRNTQALDYPADRLEILVGSDGSDDRTESIVAEAAAEDPRIRLLPMRPRRGKPSVINAAILETDAPFVVLTDANTMFDANLVRRLVTALEMDENVGAVVGEMRLVTPDGFKTEGVYWKYEVALKKMEDRLGAVLGANGGNYAIRRADFSPIPAETWIDDFVLPLLISVRFGTRVRYDAGALAWEDTTQSVEAEFERKSRIGAGNFQALFILWRLLNPLRGWVSFAFWSHKVIRWTVPFCMVFTLVASVALFTKGVLFQWLLALQLIFYAATALGKIAPEGGRLRNVLALPCYFTGMNLALANGFIRWATGRQRAAWERTQRIEQSFWGSSETWENRNPGGTRKSHE
jgi:cellulose synthase/poly-beta-1,6-N-acetylglucosamine synthase-like glycosyltransferase